MWGKGVTYTGSLYEGKESDLHGIPICGKGDRIMMFHPYSILSSFLIIRFHHFIFIPSPFVFEFRFSLLGHLCLILHVSRILLCLLLVVVVVVVVVGWLLL